MFSRWLVDTVLGRLAALGVTAVVGLLVGRGILPAEVQACVEDALPPADLRQSGL